MGDSIFFQDAVSFPSCLSTFPSLKSSFTLIYSFPPLVNPKFFQETDCKVFYKSGTIGSCHDVESNPHLLLSIAPGAPAVMTTAMLGIIGSIPLSLMHKVFTMMNYWAS